MRPFRVLFVCCSQNNNGALLSHQLHKDGPDRPYRKVTVWPFPAFCREPGGPPLLLLQTAMRKACWLNALDRHPGRYEVRPVELELLPLAPDRIERLARDFGAAGAGKHWAVFY